MNCKLLYTHTNQTFEIQHNHCGYRIFQVIAENEAKAVTGYYSTAGELVEGLAELAIFSGDDAVSLKDIKATLREIKQSLVEHLSTYANHWG